MVSNAQYLTHSAPEFAFANSKEAFVMTENMNDDPVELHICGEIQGQLGKCLRSIYQDVIEAPVPERFQILLDELSAGQKR